VKSTVGQNSIRTLIFSALNSALGIITGIVLAKTIGPYGKGVFSGIQVLQNGITAVTAGGGAAILYMLTNQKRSIGELARPLGFLLIGVTALGWLFLWIWGLHYGSSTTLLVAAAVIPAAIVLSWRGFFYMGIDQLRSLNYQGFALTLGVLLAVVTTVVVFHRGVQGAIVAWAVCLYIAAFVVVGHAVYISRGAPTDGFWDDVRSLVRFGSRTALDGLLGFFNYRIDSLVLIAFLGASGFGIYSVAVAGGEVLFMISRAVNTASAHDIGAFDLRSSAELTAKAIRMSTFVIAVAAAIAAVLGPLLIPIVYGPRFQPAGTPLRILLLGVVIYASAGTFSAFFAFQRGRPLVMLYLNAAMIALQVGLSLWLVPSIGMSGAALASTATYLFAAVFMTWYFCRTTGLRPARIWVVGKSDLASLSHAVRAMAAPARGRP